MFPDENWVECIDMKQNSLPLAKISFGAVPKFWGLFDMCPTSPYLRDFYIWEFCFLGHTTWFRSHHQLQFFPRSFPPPPPKSFLKCLNKFLSLSSSAYCWHLLCRPFFMFWFSSANSQTANQPPFFAIQIRSCSCQIAGSFIIIFKAFPSWSLLTNRESHILCKPVAVFCAINNIFLFLCWHMNIKLLQ